MSKTSISTEELIERVLNSSLTILTGKVNRGKSTCLARLIEFLRRLKQPLRIGGVLCPGIFHKGEKIGYHLKDLSKGTQTLFAVSPSLLEPGARQPEPIAALLFSETIAERFQQGDFLKIGQWLILRESLQWGRRAILDAVRRNDDLVVVDEFGKLELEGEGFRKPADALVDSGSAALLVVRQGLLEEVKALYGPIIQTVITVELLETLLR